MRNETIVNQQASATDYAWLAGIIDGEGSISMNVRKKSWNGWNGIGVDLSVKVTNTDSGIIDKCSTILEKMDINPHIFEKATNPVYKKDGTSYSSNKSILVLNVCKMSNILKLLTHLQEYLGGEKRTRARLIAKFIQNRLERKGGRSSKKGTSWYNGYDWETVKKFYEITGGKLLPEVATSLNDQTLSPVMG